jgi:hypothetical protein
MLLNGSGELKVNQEKLHSPSYWSFFILLFTNVSKKNSMEILWLPIPTSINVRSVWQHSNQYFWNIQTKKLPSEVEQLYKHQFHYIWFDKDGLNEFVWLLANKVNTWVKD